MGGPRTPAVAGLFYPADPVACSAAIKRCRDESMKNPPLLPGGTRVHAVLAPHAGWSYSGTLAVTALAPLATVDPDTVVLFGADHQGGRRGASIHPGPQWGTPLGPAVVDGEAAERLAALGAGGAAIDREAHAPEHGLEVLVPFLRFLLPRARLLPVLVPPGCGAAALGGAARRICDDLGRRSVAVGSSDLTHYGVRYGFEPRGRGAAAHRWSKKENDAALLDRAAELDAEGILRSARVRRNACGPGALAAAVAFASAAGARRGVLLAHATSAEVLEEEDPDLWVGYAAMAFTE